MYVKFLMRFMTKILVKSENDEGKAFNFFSIDFKLHQRWYVTNMDHWQIAR